MSVLTRTALLDRLRDPEDDFAVIPILEQEAQVESGAVNLRLGMRFIFPQKARFPLVCPRYLDEAEVRKFQREESFCFGQTIIIHPLQLLLACTFEFISMPRDLCGFVLTRSRYARAGLIIATATYVHPNWKGCLTLELANYGEIPIELTCGSQIGQIAVLEAKPGEELQGLKSISFGPQFSTMSHDPEWKRLALFVESKGELHSKPKKRSRQ